MIPSFVHEADGHATLIYDRDARNFYDVSGSGRWSPNTYRCVSALQMTVNDRHGRKRCRSVIGASCNECGPCYPIGYDMTHSHFANSFQVKWKSLAEQSPDEMLVHGQKEIVSMRACRFVCDFSPTDVTSVLAHPICSWDGDASPPPFRCTIHVPRWVSKTGSPSDHTSWHWVIYQDIFLTVIVRIL